jgi:hypothetical protein
MALASAMRSVGVALHVSANPSVPAAPNSKSSRALKTTNNQIFNAPLAIVALNADVGLDAVAAHSASVRKRNPNIMPTKTTGLPIKIQKQALQLLMARRKRKWGSRPFENRSQYLDQSLAKEYEEKWIDLFCLILSLIYSSLMQQFNMVIYI